MRIVSLLQYAGARRVPATCELTMRYAIGFGEAAVHVRTKRQAVLFQIWHYAHLPMFLGIGVAGVGFEHVISLKSGEQLTATEVWVLCSAVSVLMAALICISATSEVSQRHRIWSRHLWAQFGLISVAPLLAIGAAGVLRVFLVMG